MTTFREFLLNRDVISENIGKNWAAAEKDPRNKALEAFAEKYNAPTGLWTRIDKDKVKTKFKDKDEEKKYLNELNKLVAQNGGEDEFKDWDAVIDAWSEYQEKKDAYETDNSDISDVEEDKRIEYLMKALKNERIDSAITVSTETAKHIADAFIKADNKDGKINKDEFVNAIALIRKEASKSNKFNNRANIASLLYFVYLVKVVKKISGQKIITSKTDGINTQNIQHKGVAKDKIDKLNECLAYFTNIKFESNVLSIFARPNKTIEFIKNAKPENDDEQLEKIKDNFGGKKTDEPDETESSGGKKGKGKPVSRDMARAEKNMADAENDLSSHNDKLDDMRRDREAMLKDTETGRDKAVSKKKFYIFDVDVPEPSDDVSGWFSDMKDPDFAGGAMGMLQKIKDELKGYKPKTNENDLAEAITRVFKKNGIILEDYEKTSGKVNKLIGNSETKIKKYLEGAEHKAMSLKSDIDSNSSYKETIELRRQFKQLFIDLGYVLSQEIRSLVRAADLKMNSLKSDKKREEFSNYKTTDQLGQEEKDANFIIKFLNTVHKRDEQNIAKFMLLNLLNKNTTSDNIIKYLNSNTFGSNEENVDGENAYVYSGESGMIYALSSGDVKEDNLGVLGKDGIGGTIYNFPAIRARVYKKPADLFETAVGFEISKLTSGVLSRVKRAMAKISIGQEYLNAAKTIRQKVQALKNGAAPAPTPVPAAPAPQASVVSEGVFNFFKNKNAAANDNTEDTTNNVDYKNFGDMVSGKDQKQTGANVIETFKKRSYKIELGIDPMADEPASIAMRQIFKGYALVRFKNNEEYVASPESIKVLKDELDEMERKVQAGHNNADSSVVTSTNTDSTYGDGYGYNKKADAIKKKLNSTTYTYMPNSKMRIVRRTFD